VLSSVPVPVHGFPPISTPRARTLILGSLPGRASLAARQYYAMPRNAFWRILGEILGFDAGAEYGVRVAHLLDAGLALWDVLRSSVREGSLDSAIARGSIVPNDFSRFFDAHPSIRTVLFNGQAAEALFLRHVAPSLDSHRTFEYRRLPSTSPANASMPLARKLAMWRDALR
jgi:TDG/mug DNA glycosylase family protein